MTVIEYTHNFIHILASKIYARDEYEVLYSSRRQTMDIENNKTMFYYNIVRTKSAIIDSYDINFTNMLYGFNISIRGFGADRFQNNYIGAYTAALYDIALTDNNTYYIKTNSPALLIRNNGQEKNSFYFIAEIQETKYKKLDSIEHSINKIELGQGVL